MIKLYDAKEFGVFGVGSSASSDWEDIATEYLANAASQGPDSVGAALQTLATEQGMDWQDVGQKAIGSGCDAALAMIGIPPGLCSSIIGPIWNKIVNAIKDLITIEITPGRDINVWASQQTGVAVDPYLSFRDRLMDAGYYLIYFGQDKAELTAQKSIFASAGWTPQAEWSRVYGYVGNKRNYYGLLYSMSTMPKALYDSLLKKSCTLVKARREAAAKYAADPVGAPPPIAGTIYNPFEALLSSMGSIALIQKCATVGVSVGNLPPVLDTIRTAVRKQTWTIDPVVAERLRAKAAGEEGMSTGAKVALGVGAVGLLGLLWWKFGR